MKPTKLATHDEIDAACEQGKVAVQALFERQTGIIRDLEARLQKMEDQIAKNSQNSSKPPSSDGFEKRVPKSRRERSGKPSGGQVGHIGYRLEPEASPCHIKVYPVIECQNCHTNLTEVEVTKVEKRQVFDLPEVALEVTEHQAEMKRCPVCGQATHAEFPAEVSQPTQYGPRFRAQMVFFNVYHFIPLERTAEIMSELYQQPVSDGTVYAAASEVAEQVASSNELVKVFLTETEAPVHFDETGARVNGKLVWLHSASTEQVTYYEIHPKRGGDATEAIGILPKRTGWSIHDAWLPYLTYLAAKHGLCNAHLVRELIFLIERQAQAWATDFLDLLLNMKEKVDEAKSQGQSTLSKLQLAAFEQCYNLIIEDGVQANPPPVRRPNQRGRLKQSPARNLLDRLISHKDKVLAFLYDFSVPFDNNLAERDIRMVKVQQKVSGGFRSINGANAFCQIRSYISTARKNGQCVLDVLFHALRGTPYLPAFIPVQATE
ncbi:MAG: IS66 family transposase [Chloroflexota bacterium]